MKWIRDATGRFPERPFYEFAELDEECEAIVDAFLRAQYNRASYPITTNDLTILIERETDDLDLYADLADVDHDIQGVTDFVVGDRPRVRILRELAEQPWRENRLRTTLTHELGHVKFHAVLLRFDRSAQLPLFDDQAAPFAVRCHRELILGANPTDWMEWQAGYASGALLMPISHVRLLVRALFDEADTLGPLLIGMPLARELIRRMQQRFQVSADAARVRLLQLGHLTEHAGPRSVFSSSRS